MKLRSVLLLILVLILSGSIIYSRFSSSLLEGTSFSKVIYDRNGKLLRLTTSGDEKFRVHTKVSDINPDFLKALLLLEDQHFYHHLGFNPVSLFRATYSTYFGGVKMGGSTLTMQVARLKYGIYSRHVTGKLMQLLKSFELEVFHSKEDILEAYLNLAPYGGNIEGLGAASLIYFGKSPKDLTLAEILSLVVIPQSPQERSMTKKPEVSSSLLSAREKLYLRWIEKYPEDKSKVVDLRLPINNSRLAQLPFHAPHFVDFVLKKNLYQNRVETTLDLPLQSMVEQRLKAYVQNKNTYGIKNASALLINYNTMETLAYVGSADFFNSDILGQVNGITAYRSPGSTIKPFVYALAIDQGLIHAHSVLKDSPSSFGAFDPENFERDFLGPVTATQALIQSRNIPAVYLSSRVQNPSLYEFFKLNGSFFPRDEDYYGLAVVLGGAEFTMWDLARYYAMLARSGDLSDIRILKDEKIISKGSVLSREASFVILDMLAKNQRPQQNFSNQWLRNSFPVAWKTGTSNGFRDAWTIGVVGDYVLAVWLGNFDNEANTAFIGRDMAAPLFFEIADGIKNKTFYNPTWYNPLTRNIKKVKVCSLSGHLPGSHCRSQVETWFIPGKSPIKVCDIHREVLISKSTGLRVCDPLAPQAEPQVFEVWPSDLLLLFKQAGVARKVPPPFDKSCSYSEMDDSGAPPEIVSPKRDVIYNISVSTSEELNTIGLRAVANADAKELYWFIGSRFLGKAERDKPLFWKPEPGNFTVRVVDSQGRSDSRPLRITITR